MKSWRGRANLQVVYANHARGKESVRDSECVWTRMLMKDDDDVCVCGRGERDREKTEPPPASLQEARVDYEIYFL